MIVQYQTLAQSIEAEFSELERTVDTALRHWKQAQSVSVDRDAYINSVALNLHSFYAALERLFELIAVEMDGGALGGDAWHSELLRQMSLTLPDIRPAVLHKETAARLDELRKFRHVVRHTYSTHLEPARMESLVADLPQLWRQIHQDLANFISFLRNLSRADES